MKRFQSPRTSCRRRNLSKISRMAAMALVIPMATACFQCRHAHTDEKAPSGVVAWGRNLSGELGVEKDGTIKRKPPVWVVGSDKKGRFDNVAAVAVGFCSVALRDDGTVWTWGDESDRYWPVKVVGPGGEGCLTDIYGIAACQNHYLAARQDGTVWSWGYDNFAGMLGDGTQRLASRIPVQVVGPGGTGHLEGIVAVAVGDSHCLAVRDDGTVWAWGCNCSGQLGDGTRSDERRTPVQVVGPGGKGHLTDITAVAAGNDHSLALGKDGSVWAWGSNWVGELGIGTETRQCAAPSQVVGPGGKGHLTGITAVAAWDISMALRKDGALWVWGPNWKGELGDGTTIQRSSPVRVAGAASEAYLANVVAMAAGFDHSLAVRQDGTVWVWGGDLPAQLGIERKLKAHSPRVPVQMIGLGGAGCLKYVSAVAAGFRHHLAIVGPTSPIKLHARSDPLPMDDHPAQDTTTPELKKGIEVQRTTRFD